MLDERWGPDEQDLADGLRGLLEKTCDSAAVRAAEDNEAGRSPRIEAALEEFGLWDLPSDPALLAAAAWELGRSLAPVPYPERATAIAVGVLGAVYAERGWAPVGYAAIGPGPDGTLRTASLGEAHRSAAGDVLVAVTAGEDVVGDAPMADRAARLLRLLTAARAVGAAEGVLRIAVEYVKQREQFGRPIGSFQAVAHRLADAATAIDGAGLAVRKAAWVAQVEQGGDGSPDATFATIARYAAESAAEGAVAATHQVMGGYGFTIEEDCQLFSRRTRAWRLRLEPVGPDLVALSRRLLDPPERDASRWLWHHDVGMPLPRWVHDTDG